MNKSDLKVGYVVVTREGKKYMVMSNSAGGLLLIAGINDWEPLSSYDDNMNCYYKEEFDEYTFSKFDIITVFGYANTNNMALTLNINNRPLLWERKEETQEQPAKRVTNLNDLAKEVHQNAVDHGWYDSTRTFGDIVALCHSELSEALEEYRNHMPLMYFVDEITGGADTDMSHYNGQKLEGIATEMIDCIIRILDWCGANNIDVENVLRLKHEYNKTRPYKHGGKAL